MSSNLDVAFDFYKMFSALCSAYLKVTDFFSLSIELAFFLLRVSVLLLHF